MKAMVLNEFCGLEENQAPLELPDSILSANEILIRVSACGVCHTELDEIEGRTHPPCLPIVLGHQVVGRIEATGSEANTFRIGDRVGIAWIFSVCGTCKFCLAGNENLCPDFKAVGRYGNRGYARYMKVAEVFAILISHFFNDSEAVPILCAGAIGYRSL